MEKTIYAHFMKLKPTNRRVICMDMNSYFASVEQQDNPRLRNKPVIVSGEGKRTIVVAASKEAKVYGIKTGMKIYEALKLCPHLIRIAGNGDKYASLQDNILKILRKYFLCIEIASIDEVYIDTKGIKDWGKIEELCLKIKRDIKDNIGENITCSIGISTNKLMAKFASNLKKPDGLVVLKQEDIDRIIPETKVEDISGIGNRLQKRLNELGIEKFKHFKNFPDNILRREFGEHLTLFFLKTLYGIDNTPVIPYEKKDRPKSFSHAITLPYDTKSLKECKKILYSLIERAVFRMRAKEMKTKCVAVYIRYSDFTSSGERMSLNGYTDDPFIIFLKVKDMFEAIYKKGQVRQIGIYISHVKENKDIPIDLFIYKENLLNETVHKINEKFGQFTIAPLSIYNTHELNRKIHGFYRLLN